ncbi:titin homolog isoform X2 [Micropterus salmoides]|uniref:titin homolog isoform X2 n=1 Tax=Micropterus salmoides TaxID=27706 RepID=UPI0018EABD59|nr:titin homolog isoform X2 [Micropterus salmoides]
METKYPTLRRPKRKLCYLTNKESPPKEWAPPLTLGDIDRMFDDLGPSSHDDEDLLPPSPLLQTFDNETNQCEREASPVLQAGHRTEEHPRGQMGLEGDVLLPVTRSPSPKLDMEVDFPFKAYGPVKTSSPIELNMVVKDVEELDNEKDQDVSPILFACEDDRKEEAKTEPLLTQKLHCNEPVTENDDLESPPSKVALTKPKMSSQKNEVEGSHKESHPVKEKAAKKPQTDVLEGKRKAPLQENTDLPVSAVRQEREDAAPKKNSGSAPRQPSAAVSARVAKDMTAFLQKLRDAGQPKPACSRKSLSPVKVPTPPEPEDDFLILEDETPLWISIPSKTASSKKHKQSRTSSTDKDSSTDKGVKDSSLENAQKQQESEQDHRKLGSQTVNPKTKKTKGKEKNNEVTEPGKDKNELCSPEDLPAGDLMEQEKPNKKKRLKKVPSKESDEEQPKDTASRQTDEERPTLKMEKKAQKSSVTKRSKSLKDGDENAKTSRAKSLKGARKAMQGSDAVTETVKEPSQEHADAEDLGSLSDKEIKNSEAQTENDLADGNDKQNKLPVVSEGSSSEDSQMLGKRKRRQTGQWWLSCPQSTEETKVTDHQPTLKKSKPNNKEPSAAGPSPAKTKKERVLKRRNQTHKAPSSIQNTNKTKEKKTKRNKNRNTREDTPDKKKVTDKVLNGFEAEQIEEQQQEIVDQDPVPVDSSPLDLTHRDHSLSSGDHVFQRVYRHVSNEKLSSKPDPVSPRRPREQLRAAEPEKRQRKPPSKWWTVDGMSKDVESIPSQPKPHKERKKQSKMSRSPGLGTPKNGNMAVSSKPLGGTPVPLKVKTLSAPKTVKRSMATFEDIFTSVTETPRVVSSREAGQNNRHIITGCSTLSKTDEEVLSMDAGEFNSSPNQENTQNSQSDNMFKALQSGPSSMIELEQHEENDDLILPSSRVHAVLSVSDLCAPPLKPLVLQPKDKANLTEWFKCLWSSTVDNGPEITPDQFDWYFYQGRAIGILVDLNCGSICSGKILLGSYMKKPLWVDHSAATVFNLLTSSVSVLINGSKSRFGPGQSFMVPCGHAYSLQNVTAQPAVLYFTRILAEGLD